MPNNLQSFQSCLHFIVLEIFIRNYQDRKLFDTINKACAVFENDSIEQSRVRQIRRQHRRMVEGEW